MRLPYATMFCLAMMLVACGQQTKQEKTTMEFTDQVKTALADSGCIDLNSLQWTREPKDYVVKTDFMESHHRFDQCGIVMYLDSENWLKGSVEYENEEFQHLGSVVTNNGYSDWATQAIPADVKTMWYRFT